MNFSHSILLCDKHRWRSAPPLGEVPRLCATLHCWGKQAAHTLQRRRLASSLSSSIIIIHHYHPSSSIIIIHQYHPRPVSWSYPCPRHSSSSCPSSGPNVPAHSLLVRLKNHQCCPATPCRVNLYSLMAQPWAVLSILKCRSFLPEFPHGQLLTFAPSVLTYIPSWITSFINLYMQILLTWISSRMTSYACSSADTFSVMLSSGYTGAISSSCSRL